MNEYLGILIIKLRAHLDRQTHPEAQTTTRRKPNPLRRS